ncbi:MAG: hypothetical protein E6H86_01575 [Chloroflexi bacterium]|nr:MAG: hypothetical protein E6H86_01575 [Chloroflexota bacterium]
MALKIRITAAPRPRQRSLVPALVYRAEAYEEADHFREPMWGCPHDHETVEHAYHCGVTWLNEQAGDQTEAT